MINIGQPKRIKAVSISRELLQEWMTEGWTFGRGQVIMCIKGLPEGATAGEATPSVVTLYFEHESFPVVGEYETIPALVCEFSVMEDEPL